MRETTDKQVKTMTTPENTNVLQSWVMQYLYGEMTAAERQDFEQALATNATLQALLDAEQRFDSAFPQGLQPVIDAERLQGNRWLLHQNLQRESRKRFSVQAWLQGLTQRPMTVMLQGAAMAATFVLGVLVATPDATTNMATTPLAGNSTDGSLSPLMLVGNDDYEIYQMKVNSYDPASGDIDLSFSLASETRLQGNVAEKNIHQLMAVALQNDIDSASRLDTINALQPVRHGSDVYEALIYVLRNDDNPGVRYQAVQSLVSLADEDRVRDALRYALSEDVNPGVRLEAFAALASNPDAQTLEVFRRQMDEDSNEYIRAQARLIVEGSGGATIDL